MFSPVHRCCLYSFVILLDRQEQIRRTQGDEQREAGHANPEQAVRFTHPSTRRSPLEPHFFVGATWDRLARLFPNNAPEPLTWPPFAEHYFDEDVDALSRRLIVGDTKPVNVAKFLSYGAL